MTDPEHPEIPDAITDGPQAAGMLPQTEEDERPDKLKDVDTGDMFVQGGE